METSIAFSELELHASLLDTLKQNGFENASPVQELTINPILEGKDIFAQAETGSGKTGAFAIPMLEQILRARDAGKDELLFIVLSPTRELAQQTHKVISTFGKTLDVTAACLIGGENIDKQKKDLGEKPQVLVATPGRFRDLVTQKSVDIKDCCCVVFDEADRLFDMGFKPDIEFVLTRVPKTRQLVMVSATSNMDVLNTAYKFHSDPTELKLNAEDLLVENINHSLAMISKDEKMAYLVNMLRNHEDTYAIIFCNTQFQTHLVSEWLQVMNFKSQPISGALPQNKRTRLMEDFRNKKVTILVCTDVAARGLDIKDVNLVVNFDLPLEAANYVHRIGRTGRAGKSGKAVSFCAYSDCEQLEAINDYIGIKIPKEDIKDEDFDKNLSKKPFIDRKTLRVVERDNSRYESRERKPREERKPRHEKKHDTLQERRPKQQERPAEREHEKVNVEVSKDRKSTRVFNISSYNKEEADQQAMNYLRIQDAVLLGSKVLDEGSKKFFLFGPRKASYEYWVKPIYKRLLTPFLIDLFKKAQLKIYSRVSFREPSIRVNFSGKDSGLLTANKYELQNSVEHLVKLYLTKRVGLPRDLKLSIQTEKGEGRDHGRRDKRYDKQDKDLITLVDVTKAKILENKDAVLLNTLNPAERRIIHQYISEDSKFQSNSIGDGRFKRIEISLK
jgi:ATP-dependent RNA helicase RhlE